jgi:thymidylate synthase
MSQMLNFHDVLARTMQSKKEQLNVRTGKVCRFVVGEQLVYNLEEGFPILTSRQAPFKGGVGELVGFYRGYDSADLFRSVGCPFWDINANETEAWLNNPYRFGRHDYLGRIYGKQWTDWKDRRIVDSPEERDRLLAQGFALRMTDVEQGLWLMERSINQLEEVVRKIFTDPSDRRNIVTGWRPDEFEMMALPPCHMDYRFVAHEAEKTLHVVMTMRSADLYLGVPNNIVTTSVFLATVARLTGYKAGTVTIQMTNAHIYEDHYDVVNELLSRDHFPSPQLIIKENVKQLQSLDEIKGAFLRIEPSDFHLDGYKSHGKLPAPMAA